MSKYLLDTNAYFNMIYSLVDSTYLNSNENLKKISSKECFISRMTEIEIISVIGKYARGENRSKQKCKCIISENGDICGNYCYRPERKKWNSKKTKAWIKLVKDISKGKSSLMRVEVLPINEMVLENAQLFINKSLQFNFGSHDSIIAATAQANSNENDTMIVATSDKGLKAGMNSVEIPIFDPYKMEI